MIQEFPFHATLIRFVAIAMALFHLYTGAFGEFAAILQRSIHLGFAMVLVILLYPSLPVEKGRKWRIADIAVKVLLVVVSITPLVYLWENFTYLTAGRFQFVTPLSTLETVLGIMMIAAVLVLTRRVTGWVLPLIVMIFLAYPFIPDLPGVLSHAGQSLDIAIDTQYLTLAGIFSTPLGASASFIALFIIFGAFLERSGLGTFILDFSTGIMGKQRGGPAKVAVVASAMSGTISGSAVANVVTTGSITIPLMKRIGYPPHMAGAIEAAASTGGALMPPLMGNVAFIMAQFTAIPYALIALYGLIPGLLYFLGIFCVIHWAAVRYGIGGLSAAELPDWVSSLKKRGHLLIPLVILVWLLAQDYSPQYAVTYAIASVIVVAAFRKDTRMGLRDILAALEAGGKGTLVIAMATAAAGMIVGVFELTSVGVKLAQSGAGIADSLFVALLITMAVSIILGMGVPPSVSYITQIVVTIPMLQAFLLNGGMDPDLAILTSHFFVIYFSTLAVLTPPDALASIAAAGVAGSSVMRTALTGTRVAFVAFVVPFMFVYRPALLMQGSVLDVITALAFAIPGIVILSIALEGAFLRRLTGIERILAFVSGGLLIVPTQMLDFAGLGLMIVLGSVHWWRTRHLAAA